MAELFGRDGGYSKGKGGSMHIFDIEHHFYGGYGIVGGQIPLAAGMAFASRTATKTASRSASSATRRRTRARSTRRFNMASKWKLPVIYICENNRYGMGTAIARVVRRAGDPQARRGLRDARRGGRRHGRAQDVRGGEGLRRVLPRGQGPGAARGEHLPLPRPLDGRPGDLPQKDGGRGGARRTIPIPKLREHLLKKKARDRGASSTRSTTR